jgi:hypothetical protein
MWHDTPTPNELRDTFPDLALAMETNFLSNSLDQLGIQHIRRSRKKTAVLEVAMQDSYLLRIRPVDKGAKGYSEWMTWHWKHPESEDQSPELTCSVRAFVEFIDLNNEDESPVISFTTHSEDMRDLMHSAIGGMRHLTGKKLKPVVNRRRVA